VRRVDALGVPMLAKASWATPRAVAELREALRVAGYPAAEPRAAEVPR
jgi:hypothetical protein